MSVGTISAERMQKIVNWTFPGLTLYYRDSDLPPQCVTKYQPGTIIMARAFVDVASKAGKPTKNTRFIFASSKAAKMFEVNPDVGKWTMHTLCSNSFFKVLDVCQMQGVTQVLLLHIPYKAVELFHNRMVLMLNDENLEDRIRKAARDSLATKLVGPVQQALEEEDWIARTSFPIGMNDDFELFPLVPQDRSSLIPGYAELYSAIRTMTSDLSEINNPFETDASSSPKAQPQESPHFE